MNENRQHKAIEKLLKDEIDPLFKKHKIRLGKITTQSRHMVERLYSTMKKAKKEWLETKKYMVTSEVATSFSIASEFKSIPGPIRQDFRESANDLEKQYQFYIDNRNIKVSLSFSRDQFTNVFCHDCIEKIFIWLYVAIHYGLPAKPCSETLAIHIYFSKEPKELPHGGEPIDTHNANTGFSYACPKNNDIYIYRHEEWFKVFIHETIHGLGLDFSQLHDQTISNNRIRKLFSLSPAIERDGVFLYEAYCEFVAEIMNVIISISSLHISERKTRKKTTTTIRSFSIRPPFSHICAKIRQEQLFSLFQSVKILRHNGMTYQELLNGPKQYHEKTHALSYYIIRSLLLFHFGEFLEWIDHHSAPKKSLNFPKTPDGISAFCDFIEERYKSDDYCLAMEILAIWYEKNVKRNPDFEQGFLHKTLRMTS